MKNIVLATCAVGLSASVAWAAPVDKFSFTDAEKAACQEDSQKYCNSADQDVDKLLVCMKANKQYLSPQCASAFDQALEKRGMK